MQIAYLFTLILFVHSQETPSTENVKRRKQDFYCSGIHKEKQLDWSICLVRLACKSMSETMFREMTNVDPNERVKVGSYRVDGHGHQKLKEVHRFLIDFNIEIVLK